MNGRRNDIVTQEQLDEIVTALPLPEKCDGCSERLIDANRFKHPYGPFFLHVCGKCKLKLVRADNMKASVA